MRTTLAVQQANDIAFSLNGLFHAFSASSIGSDDYRDKGVALHRTVLALAELHPNWRKDKRTIPHRQGWNTPQLDEGNPDNALFDIAEDVFRAWRTMRIFRPSIHSLSTGSADFTIALTKLRDECTERINQTLTRAVP